MDTHLGKAYLGDTRLSLLEPWRRPADWQTCTVPGPTEQKVVALVAVANDSVNYVALKFTLFESGEKYVVNWGDGTADSEVVSGYAAEHLYTYASLSGNEFDFYGTTMRQAVITVTPKVNGKTFKHLYFDNRHSALSTAPVNVPIVAQKWLEIICVSPTATNFRAGRANTNYAFSPWLEHVVLVLPELASLNSAFHSCYNLQKVEISSVENVTDVRTCFQSCLSLVEVPDMNLQNVTAYGTDMFNGCYSVLDLSNVNISTFTSLNRTFTGCYRLAKTPRLNIPNCTNLNTAFYNCRALREINIEALGTLTGTALYQAFFSCSALTSVTELDCTSCTSLYRTFYVCYALDSVPLTNTGSVTDWTETFNGCYNLASMPALSMAGANAAAGNVFYACRGLGASLVTGMKYAHSYANCMLNKAALDGIVSRLGTAPSAQAFTVTGNPGAATCNAPPSPWTITR